MTDFSRAFNEAQYHESLIACIQQSSETEVPLLALGQTVFWDELLKSMIVAAARRHAPRLRMTAGVHDTDYFSKLAEAGMTDGGFSLQPRDDDRTRQMWAAVAETSAVLGSEHAVTRAQLRAAGLPLRQLAREHPDGPRSFYREATVAWGWRGVANHSAGRMVACDISARQISETVRELMAWAMQRSEEVLLDDRSHVACTTLLELLNTLCASCNLDTDDLTLTDLYICLLEGYYRFLAGELPETATITASTSLFRFTCETIDAPRFDIVDVFLDPTTRQMAADAYDRVVAHSGIYRLHQFGENTIPFDIVVCGRGRGTIHVSGERALFDMPEGPVEGVTSGEITDRQGLLAAIADAFNCDALLVGKAIVLPLMLSREYSMVLLENASVYVPQTHRLVRLLRRCGVELDFNPILRLHFETWDCMQVAEADLQLPGHLARFFDDDCMNARVFSEQWRGAVAYARALIERLGAARAPAEIAVLLEEAGEEIEELSRQHREIAQERRRSGEQIERLCERTQALWLEMKQLLREADARHEAPPDDELARIRKERHSLIGEIVKLTSSDEHEHLQESYRQIVLEIRRRKLQLVADAHRTVGLEDSNYRPPWWWFFAVDPTGAWLRQLAENASMRFEPLGMKV